MPENKTLQQSTPPARMPVELLEDPLDVAFQIVGRKWTVHILREAMQHDGVVRFNELLHRVQGLNAKSLSARLKELEAAGIFERRVVPATPVRTEYRLTEKGWALRPILIAMAWFSLRWNPQAVLDQAKPLREDKLWRTIYAYCGETAKECGWPMDESRREPTRA